MLEVSDFIPALEETTKRLNPDYSKDTFPLVRIVSLVTTPHSTQPSELCPDVVVLGSNRLWKRCRIRCRVFCLFPNTIGQVTIWQIKLPTLMTLSDGASIG
jgi:hypothetical protein